jgi:hypothetical protein
MQHIDGSRPELPERNCPPSAPTNVPAPGSPPPPEAAPTAKIAANCCGRCLRSSTPNCAAAAPDHAPAKCPEDTQLCHITEIRRIIVEPKYRIVDQKGDEIASGEEQDPKPPIMISPRPGLWIRDPTWHLQMLLGTMVLRRALPSVPQG